MIPQKIQALFEFIDFLDENKNEYIEKYIPLCDELRELGIQRSALRPDENYKDKQSYDKIQAQIAEKFAPIAENIYKPITNKLRELGIWSGDEAFASIWNNNFPEIFNFKQNFSEEDTQQIFQYKQKYLSFRTDTNNDFLCLSFVFQSLDEILKELFDFFKDTKENEFDKFETKAIEVKDFTELAKKLSEDRGKNVKYSIPTKSVFEKKQPIENPTTIRNEIIVGDKIEFGNITNKKGRISVKTTTSDNKDELSKKTYDWQKWGIIVATIIGIVTLLFTTISPK